MQATNEKKPEIVSLKITNIPQLGRNVEKGGGGGRGGGGGGRGLLTG